MKRQWILTDTGTVRRPVKGEFYLDVQSGRPMQATDHEGLQSILHTVFVELPDETLPQCLLECEDLRSVCAGVFRDDVFEEPWGCTRGRGHDGPHVACSTDGHDLAVWPQDSASDFDEWNW